jgi:hypothetical protein
MSRKRRRLSIPPSQRDKPRAVAVPASNLLLPVITAPGPVIPVEPPSLHPKFAPTAKRIAGKLGMSRRQLADLLEEGNEDEALRVIEQASQPCGDCQLCCELIAIHALDKPTYQLCPNQCATGCAIHGTHPDECRTYACFWKMRWIDEGVEFRPDNLGAVFDFEQTVHGPVIRVWQTESGMVLDHPEVRRITIEMANQLKTPVFVNYMNNDRSIFLIPSLARWRPAFEKRFPGVPVYDLPELAPT